MAMVQVDLSEYDMLREAKNKAEEEVKRLKEINKGLEERSRVIIKYESVPFNFEKGIDAYNNYRFYRGEGGLYVSHEDCFRRGVHAGLGKDNNPPSSQYIGFDDIKNQVEEDIKKQYEDTLKQTLKEAEESKRRYESMLKTVKEDVEKANAEKIESLKKELKSYEEIIEKLSKTHEEKEAEALKELEEAKKKYEDLVGKKNKNIFTKIFK